MKSISFVIEYSAMAHLNQSAVAKLCLKKTFNKILFCGRSKKGAAHDERSHALNFKLAFLHKFHCDIGTLFYHWK